MSQGPPTEDLVEPSSREVTEASFDGTAGETAATLLPKSLLSDERYREVLQALVEQGGDCSLVELNRVLVDGADWPHSTMVSDSPYRVTHIALVREYVPVLEQFGAVEYDEEIGTVSLSGTNGSSDRRSRTPQLD